VEHEVTPADTSEPAEITDEPVKVTAINELVVNEVTTSELAGSKNVTNLPTETSNQLTENKEISSQPFEITCEPERQVTANEPVPTKPP
jgi:hypothetical protein